MKHEGGKEMDGVGKLDNNMHTVKLLVQLLYNVELYFEVADNNVDNDNYDDKDVNDIDDDN